MQIYYLKIATKQNKTETIVSFLKLRNLSLNNEQLFLKLDYSFN